jgi:hypothetical protein
MRGLASHDKVVLAGVALFASAHLAWLPRHLEDIDSINFALALRDYDIASHQPHAPGYPVFVVLARVLAAALSPWLHDEATRAAVAMALLATIAASLALLALYGILIELDRFRSDVPRTAWPALAVAATAAAPLFWVTAVRPLSDMAGLAGALGCHWLIVRAGRVGVRLRDGMGAAAACGVAVGLRSQVAWLVVPLLLWLVVVVWRRSRTGAALAVCGAALAGVLVWAVPMVVLTGGPAAYRDAFVSQAGEDLEGVPMLALRPSPRQAVVAAIDTFVSPWASWPIAGAVLVLAAVGLVSLHRHRAHAWWLSLGLLPYAIYHVLFQETETTRYALPLVPGLAVLMILAARRWPRVLRPAVVLTVVLALGMSVVAHQQFVTTRVSVHDTLRRLESSAADATSPPQVLMHRRVWAETRRAREALAGRPSYEVLPAPRSFEWKEALPAWRADLPVWWLVDPRRGDDVVIDPRNRVLEARIAWPEPVASVLGGMRPHAFDWYKVSSPRWILLDGWGLTPELAGLTHASGRRRGPAEALIRTASSATTLLIGGRYVGPPDGPPERLRVRVGAAADETAWSAEVAVRPGPFVFTWAVPPATRSGELFVPLSVTAIGSAGGDGAVHFEQFDAQPVGTPVAALDGGWYEPERDTRTGRRWRWVGPESVVRIAGAEGDVRLDVSGTYPRHYARTPVLEMRAGDTVIGRHTLRRPFLVTQRVTAAQLAAASGRLTWHVSESFVAGERTGTADARRLALEIAMLRIDAFR